MVTSHIRRLKFLKTREIDDQIRAQREEREFAIALRKKKKGVG